MGLRITVPGANFEDHAIGFTPAVPSGLVGLFFLNGAVEKARRNLVVGRAAASVVGSPLPQTGMIRFRGNSDFLQTDIPETRDLTILVVGKCPDTMADDAHRAMYVTNFGSAPTGSLPSYGAGIYTQTATRLLMAGTRFNDAASTTTTAGGNGSTTQNPATLSFLCGRTRDDRTEMNNLTQNLDTALNASYPRYLSQGAMRIGSGYSSAFQGLADLAFVAIYNRFIDNAERDAMYAQVKAYMSRRFGLTV